MTRITLSLIAAALLTLTASGCDSGEAGGDSENASFGIGKADHPAGGFSACELRETLEIINESTSTTEFLADTLGLNARAAKNIVAHRIGPDEKAGTGDDDIFDDLAELDAVPFVGPKALEVLAKYGQTRCGTDLSNRPYIDASTFAGNTGGGWTRDSVELEATMNVTGITGSKLREILDSTDDRDRTVFSRLRKVNEMEAFSFGFALDEIPWSSKATDARLSMPYTAWTIENDRFAYEDGTGERELSLGTDKMDDAYYDTVNFDLLEEGMTLRGRVRWDTDTEVRRLLIAAKLDGAVDADGLKRAAKVDVRTEGGKHTATLDDDVRSGTVPWSFERQPIKPVEIVYNTLKAAGRLQNVGGKTDVLLLDPKVRIRSVRSRYHLNFAKPDAMRDVYMNGVDRISEVLTIAGDAVAAGKLSSGDAADVDAMATLGWSIVDNSGLLAAARTELEAIDPTLSDIIYPERLLEDRPKDFVTLEKRRIIAETAARVFADFADQLDDVDRALTGTDDLDHGDYADMFIEWQKLADSGLTKYQTVAPFKAVYDAANADDGTREQFIKDFNTFGAAQKADGNDDFEDFETVDATVWENLGKHLVFEHLKIIQRQVATAGSIAKAIWWELAREYYVPDSDRSYGNFIIDTMDFTEMITEEEWQRIPADQRTAGDQLPNDKIFHATLVNEVQLELTEVAEYIARIEALTKAVADDPNDAEAARNLAGAKFVFEVLEQSIQQIATLKADSILDDLEDEGAPDTIDWLPALNSKGKTALLIITDKQ